MFKNSRILVSFTKYRSLLVTPWMFSDRRLASREMIRLIYLYQNSRILVSFTKYRSLLVTPWMFSDRRLASREIIRLIYFYVYSHTYVFLNLYRSLLVTPWMIGDEQLASRELIRQCRAHFKVIILFYFHLCMSLSVMSSSHRAQGVTKRDLYRFKETYVRDTAFIARIDKTM